MQFCPLFSGSSGNSLWLCEEDTALLIDAGMPASTTCQALEKLPSQAAVQGILITHEHSDHVKCLGPVCRKLDVPVYATAATWQAMMPKLGAMAQKNVRVVAPDEDFYIGDVCVRAFSIPHDAADPVGYHIAGRRSAFAVATDIGHVTAKVLGALSEADLVMLESNHDLTMLAHGPYPQMLKKRILSHKGHLSNPDCAKALCTLASAGLRQAVLGHLSQDNNTPQLAHATAVAGLLQAGIRPGADIKVTVACTTPLEVFSF